MQTRKIIEESVAAARLKVGCAKDTNWLLFDPNQLERFAHQNGGTIKNREEKS